MEITQAKTSLSSKILWSLVAIIGAISFGILAVSRGEHVNAVWLVLEYLPFKMGVVSTSKGHVFIGSLACFTMKSEKSHQS